MLRKLSFLFTLILTLAMVTPVFAQETTAAGSHVYLPLVTASRSTQTALQTEVAAEEDLTDGVVDAASSSSGAIFATTNSTDTLRGNEVVMYQRATDGTLTLSGRFPTNGLGLGTGLGSQGALALSNNGRWLFVVNAGSNEITVFAVQPAGLIFVDKVASGGVRPISLTVRKNLVYVLNAGDPGNITGFKLGENGKLTPLADSTRSLSNNGNGAAPGPAQVSFTPDGDHLVVTEKATKLIDTYRVQKNGLATGPVTNPSAGTTPFGFAFARGDALIVSEAFGGAVNGSAVSSYQVDGDQLRLVSGSVLTGQTAACWIAIANDGKIAYSTNAGSASISAYQVGKGGALTLLNGRAGDTGVGTGPADPATSHNGRFLYVLSPRSQTIISFAIQTDGSLISLGSVGGLPLGSAGIAAW
ncbi:MAG: beta-propeller fold lactonase family protein [Chloroflexi bacterium]|nr:beta-propeller fold lactonase family protein [Chloroflexota bacterium]